MVVHMDPHPKTSWGVNHALWNHCILYVYLPKSVRHLFGPSHFADWKITWSSRMLWNWGSAPSATPEASQGTGGVDTGQRPAEGWKKTLPKIPCRSKQTEVNCYLVHQGGLKYLPPIYQGSFFPHRLAGVSLRHFVLFFVQPLKQPIKVGQDLPFLG